MAIPIPKTVPFQDALFIFFISPGRKKKRDTSYPRPHDHHYSSIGNGRSPHYKSQRKVTSRGENRKKKKTEEHTNRENGGRQREPEGTGGETQTEEDQRTKSKPRESEDELKDER